MVDIRVSPTEQHPTHDISLTDGTTTIGLHLCDGRGKPERRSIRQSSMPRTSLQIKQGNPNYSDYVMPYTPITQNDFSGGRASEKFEQDNTRYLDSYGVDTRLGDLRLGPEVTRCEYFDRVEYGNPTSYEAISGVGVIASVFTPSAEFALKSVGVWVSNPDDRTLVSVDIYADDGTGKPTALGTSVAQGRLSVPAGTNQYIRIQLSYTLAAATSYWFALTPDPIRDISYGIITGSGATGKKIARSTTGWTVATDQTIAFDFSESADSEVRFFEYKNTTFAWVRPTDRSASVKLWQNGLRGMAASNAANKSNLYTALNLSGVDLSGKFVKIVAGPGSQESVPWRFITGNSGAGTNDVIYVTPPWRVEHTTATEFVVLGMDTWTEITGHGISNVPSDVCVADSIVHFPQSTNGAMRSGRLNAGAWEWFWQGGNETNGILANNIKLITDSTGTRKIWYTIDSRVVYSDVKGWNEILDTTSTRTPIQCGNAAHRITNLLAYGSPTIPWIIKEDEFGSINEGVYAPVPLTELRAAASEENGRAVTQLGVYLFFGLLDGLERYYESRLDDLGPNRDEGFPQPRKGCFAQLIPYPGGIIGLYDGGNEGISSVLFWNQTGWHELHRGTFGRRIMSGTVQIIPGNTVDRLWFNEGEELKWIPMCINPRQQADYRYRTTGYLITSWFTGGYAEIDKFFKSLAVTADDMSANQTVTASYQVEGESADTWHALPDVFDTSPSQEILLTSDYSAHGKAIRFKLALATTNAAASPRVRALTINIITRVTPKRSWSLTFFADDYAVTDGGDSESEALDADALMQQLETWADSDRRATPLTMRSIMSRFDNARVFIDPPSLSPVEIQVDDDQRRVKLVINMAAYEA